MATICKGAPRSLTSLSFGKASRISTVKPVLRSRMPVHQRLQTLSGLATRNTIHRSTQIRSFHISWTRLNENRPNKEGEGKNNGNKDNNSNKEDGKDKRNEFGSLSEYFRSKEFANTMFLTIGFTIIFTLLTPSSNNSGDDSNRVSTFQDFKTKYLEKGLVSKIYVVNKFLVEAELVNTKQVVSFTIGSVDIFEEQMDQIQDLLNIPPRDRIPIKYIERSSPFTFLFPFLPTIILLGGLYFITRKINSSPPNANGGGGGGLGGMFNVGKSRAKLFNKETDIKISFKNVAGCDEAKQEIMEFVHFLKNPGKYTKLGAKIPRGAILSGPPGTGKTLWPRPPQVRRVPLLVSIRF